MADKRRIVIELDIVKDKDMLDYWEDIRIQNGTKTQTFKYLLSKDMKETE